MKVTGDPRIKCRCVPCNSGAIDRFGFIDPTDGGPSHRYSLAADWSASLGKGTAPGCCMRIDYDLDLVSNFSYLHRSREWRSVSAGRRSSHLRRRLGLASSVRLEGSRAGVHGGRAGPSRRHRQSRSLSHDRSRAFRHCSRGLGQQTSYAVYSSLDTRWTDSLRTTVGLRADHFDFDVDANLAVNSGSASDSLVSPSSAVVLGPWSKTEFFVNVGPRLPQQRRAVRPSAWIPPMASRRRNVSNPLVKALGTDLGLRTAIAARTRSSSVSLWSLDLDSELLFIGDAGNRRSEPRKRAARCGSGGDLESDSMADHRCRSRLVAGALCR